MTAKEKVRKELKDIKSKCNRLYKEEINGAEFIALSKTEQSLLQQQYVAMTEYRHILVLRLHYWTK